MTLDILRKHGGWCVELQQPLKHHTGDVPAIELRRPTADHVIRWNAYEIPSLLALMSELCGLPEKLLRQLPSDDFERVMFAFLNVIPGGMKAEIDEGKRMLATPEDQLPQSEQIPVPDQTDPRFPATTGPVVRLSEKRPQPPDEDIPPIQFGSPPATEAVR